MQVVWCAAGLLLGTGLGFLGGMLLRTVIGHWESTDKSVSAFRVVLLLLFGGGAIGATPLFTSLTDAGSNAAAFYLLGLGAGLIAGGIGLFHPSPPYTLGRIKTVIRMSDSLRADHPDPDQRATLIATALLPPKVLERADGISEPELAKQLEDATDPDKSADPAKPTQP